MTFLRHYGRIHANRFSYKGADLQPGFHVRLF